MQITLRVTYRSRHREGRVPRESSGLHSPHHSPSHARPLRSDQCSVSRVSEERETISGVNTLNHFLDLPKKLLEPPLDASLAPVEAVSEDILKAIQLDRILVEEVQVLPESRIVAHSDPRSAGADRFRFLRMCLRELWSTGKLKTLQITSPLPQEGKSTIALNLATMLAEGGKRTVLLIEADLHRPSLTKQLGIEKRGGLADCLEGSLTPEACLRRLEPLGWYFLSAGEPHANPTELLQTESFAVILHRLSPYFDWILIDSPPVIPLTDALSLARQANATLLVAREGQTPREAIERAIAILGRQRVLGIVLNAVENLDRMYSGYYGYSGYPASNGSSDIGRGEAMKKSLARPAVPTKLSILGPPKQ